MLTEKANFRSIGGFIGACFGIPVGAVMSPLVGANDHDSGYNSLGISYLFDQALIRMSNAFYDIGYDIGKKMDSVVRINTDKSELQKAKVNGLYSELESKCKIYRVFPMTEKELKEKDWDMKYWLDKATGGNRK